jgi:hypothetical protein
VALSDTLAVGLLLGFAGLLVVLTLTERRWPVSLRTLPAFDRLRREIERSVEAGERVHVSLGTGSLIGSESSSALAGLSALAPATQVTLDSDLPVVVSSGDGAVAAASQDALRGMLGALGAGDRYRWTRARMLAPTPFSYVATLPGMLEADRVSVNLLLGHFGSEGALVADMARRQRSFSLAGTDAVLTQALFYATADEPLVGEEAYAAAAYLGGGGMARAGLRVQDVARAAVIALILIGTVLRTLGVTL